MKPPQPAPTLPSPLRPHETATVRAPLLLVDAGNSRIKWTVVRPGEAAADAAPAIPGEPVHGNAAQTFGGWIDRRLDDTAVADLRARWALLPEVRAAVISNVAGADVGDHLVAEINLRWPNIMHHAVRAQKVQCGVTNGYDAPQKLGSDRWAGLIGARTAYPNQPVVIATVGTAATVDALTEDGHFLGGWIAPGLQLMLRVLSDHTAQLPPAAWPREGTHQAPAGFETETLAAMTHGCALALAGLIERGRQTLQAYKGTSRQPVRCILAGGGAGHIAPFVDLPWTRHDDLVLRGLAEIARDIAP